MDDDRGARARVSLGAALRVAPLVQIAVNISVVLATWRMPTAGPLVRAAHLALTTGEVMALALVTAMVTDAWARWLPARRRLRTAALFAGGVLIGRVIFEEDMLQMGDLVALAVAVAFGAGLALVPVARAAAARWRIARVVLLVAGVGAAVANHFVLRTYYPGAHLTLSFGSLLACGLAIAGLPRFKSIPSGVRTGSTAVASLLAAFAIGWRPSGTVALEMARDESAPLYRYVAPVRGAARRASSLAAVDPASAQWFAPRAGLPDVPPTPDRTVPVPDLVLLLTIDALRYDRWADPANASSFKNLKSLARRSVELQHAHATGSLTVPSVSSMLSGLYFSQRYWTRTPFLNGYRSFLTKDTSPGLCDLLQKGGVRAATILSTDGLKPQFGVVRGCESVGGDVTGHRRSSEMMDDLIRWVGALEPGTKAFAYAHFLDAHDPYDLAGEHGSPEERQLRELALVDEQVGRLVTGLKQSGHWGRTALLVTADHGESFGEHGAKHHGANVHEELTRVPMFVLLPGARPRAVEEPASGIDLTPTVLDIFELPVPGALMGQSLLPLVLGREVTLTRPIVFDSSKQQRGMLFRDGIKVIHRGLESSFELYDLRADPGELTNLVDTHPEAEARIGALVAFFEAHTYRKFGYRVPTR